MVGGQRWVVVQQDPVNFDGGGRRGGIDEGRAKQRSEGGGGEKGGATPEMW